MEPARKKLISIVTPVFNEELNVTDCYQAIRRLFERELPQYDYEHIFCDNVSTDQTVPILKQLAAADRRVKIIVNARNFGIPRSSFNGILSTSGDAVVVLFPVDLQDPPELIVEFVKRWEQGYEVVYGIRTAREESRLMRNIRRLYYRLVSRLADIDVPPDVGSFQLVDRVVIDALRRCDDYYPHIPGLIAHCGFRATGIPYTWKARARGLTKNRLHHLIDEGLNGLISSSRLPMRLSLFIGFALSVLSITYAFLNLAITLIYYRKPIPPGIPTLIIAIFFFSGVQLFFFGVLGEYISAIHCQVRKRPVVVERERVNFAPRDPAPGQTQGTTGSV